MLGVHLGFEGEQSVHELFLTHFQAEHCYRHSLFERHILCDIQDKRGFAHGRTRRNQNQVRGLQSRCLIVQVNKTCRDSRYVSFIAGSLFDSIHRVHNDLTDRDKITRVSALNQIKDLFLRRLKDFFQTLLACIAGVRDFLIQPNQLAQLTAELTGCENVGELLCNSSFMEIVNEIGELSQNLLDELGMTPQMFTEMAAATDTNVNAEQLSADIQVPENDNAVQTAADAVPEQMISDAKDDKTVQTVLNADEVETQKPEDNIVLQKEVADNVKDTDDVNDGLMPEKTEEPDVKTESDKGQQTGSKNESGNASGQTAFVNQEHVADPATVKTPENVPEFSRQLDTLDLIRQVTEFTKITVREAQTTMEMQLNPEHLGKIYIEVTTKEGNVSAHIMTQNELVKEALEAQMAELKQSMNQAGVKVDAVEVTVGSHEFEKNLEQNAKQEERQAEEQEKASPKTRRINLDELDELSGVMSEEEALVAQIMADHGNSVDYTA